MARRYATSLAELKRSQEYACAVLEEVQEKIQNQFPILENYFDYDDDNETIRAVKAIRVTIDQIIHEKKKMLTPKEECK